MARRLAPPPVGDSGDDELWAAARVVARWVRVPPTTEQVPVPVIAEPRADESGAAAWARVTRELAGFAGEDRMVQTLRTFGFTPDGRRADRSL